MGNVIKFRHEKGREADRNGLLSLQKSAKDRTKKERSGFCSGYRS